MNKCNGWERSPHDTTRPLTKVVTDGCKFCTGLECGDFPEVLYLCPKCLEDYKRERGRELK